MGKGGGQVKEYCEVIDELASIFPDLRQEDIQGAMEQMLESGADLCEAEAVVKFMLAGALESNREKTELIAYFTVREILLIPEEAKAKVRKFMSMEE